MQPRFTAHRMCAASASTSISAKRPLGKRTVAVCIQSGLGGTRFWKKPSPSTPFGQRYSVVGRLRARQRPRGHIAVVVDQLQFGSAQRREEHLLGVADLDLAAVDLDRLVLGGHLASPAGGRGTFIARASALAGGVYLAAVRGARGPCPGQ